MCGIVGLFLKNTEVRSTLGAMFEPMLVEMTSRGPDSAGVAIYRDPADDGAVKFSLAADEASYDWANLASRMKSDLGCDAVASPIDTHCVLTISAGEATARRWLAENAPKIRVVGAGTRVEIFKETGTPQSVYDRFGLKSASGTHMIGHTRMATESAVTTAGSHPFATGADLCLVHNGSLSNHNLVRERLKKSGMTFQTENDSEVAAAYMTAKLRDGATIDEALTDAIEELDGFYTFCIGTRDGFAVLRDPIACKHAVLAETDDWVAMATEFRAIARLPGAEVAHIWEPKPKTIYTWGGNEGANGGASVH
ncbi:MAG: amidophosphoribosyltransferase [Pseudomonadota bacterium]